MSIATLSDIVITQVQSPTQLAQGAAQSVQLLNATAIEPINAMMNTTITSINATALATTNASMNATGMFGGMFVDVSGQSLAIAGAAIAVGAAGLASAIGAGLVGAVGARSVSEDPKGFSTSLLFQALPQTQGIYGFLIAILILLGAGVIGTAKEITVVQGLGALGAGLAVGLAAVSAIGQGITASSAVGAVAEDKKMFGKSILFSVLPETQALYGFIVSILILIGLGLFGAAKGTLTLTTGWAAIGAGLAVGIAAFSAIGQGIAASGGISAVLEKPKSFGKAILFSVLPETQALYGFIIAILILIGFGILGVPRTDLGIGVGMFALAAGLSVGIASLSAIGQGIAAKAGIEATARDDKMFGKSILFSVLPETQALYGFLIAILLLVGGGILGATRLGIDTPLGVFALGASLASGISAISAIGQGNAASAGIEAVKNNPKSFGKAILFSVLPETQALYGFIIAILILIGTGIIGTLKLGLTLPLAIIAVGAGLAVGLGAISAIGQGLAARTGIETVAKDSKFFGKSILFSVLPETQALYGFLIAILLLVGGGILGTTTQGLSIATGLMAIGAGLAVGLGALSAIGQGTAASSGIIASARDPKIFGKSILFSVLPETQALYGFLIAILLLLGGGIVGAAKSGISLSVGLIGLGAGLAVGLAAISAIGQGLVASAGIGATLENSKSFGKSILFSVLPETQALYGFLVAILLLVGGGVIGAVQLGLSTPLGIMAIGISLSVGLAAISAIGQGTAAASGVGAVAEKPEMFGKSIIFSIIPETQALMGFLIAILILIGSGLMGATKLALTTASGLVSIGAGLAVGIAAMSAVGQGFVVSSGIGQVSRDQKMFGKSLLFSVLPQTQALYGFLIAILLLVGGGIIGVAKPDLAISVGLLAMGAGLAVGLAAMSAVGQGLVASAGVRVVGDNNKMFGKSILFSVLPETQALYGFLVAILLLVGGGVLGATKIGLTVPLGLVAIGAGLSVGIAALSAVGQGLAASSGAAAVIENERTFGKGILFSVLPETQALYGLIIAILLMVGVGLLGTFAVDITLLQGIGAIGAGLAMGFAAISAVGQGVVASGSIAASVRDAKSMGKGLVLSVIPETYAIFGLLIAILMLLGLKLL